MSKTAFFERKIITYCKSVVCDVPFGFIDCRAGLLANFLPREYCTRENLPFIRFLYHRKEKIFVIQILTPVMTDVRKFPESFSLLLCRKLSAASNTKIPNNCVAYFSNEFQSFSTNRIFLRELEKRCPVYYTTPDWFFYNPNLCVSLTGIVTGASFFTDDTTIPIDQSDEAQLAPPPVPTPPILTYSAPLCPRPIQPKSSKEERLIDEVFRTVSPVKKSRHVAFVTFLSKAYDSTEKEVIDIVKTSSNSRILGFIADAL